MGSFVTILSWPHSIPLLPPLVRTEGKTGNTGALHCGRCGWGASPRSWGKGCSCARAAPSSLEGVLSVPRAGANAPQSRLGAGLPSSLQVCLCDTSLWLVGGRREKPPSVPRFPRRPLGEIADVSFGGVFVCLGISSTLAQSAGSRGQSPDCCDKWQSVSKQHTGVRRTSLISPDKVPFSLPCKEWGTGCSPPRRLLVGVGFL